MDKKSVIWLILVVVIALAIGRFVPSSPVGGSNPAGETKPAVVETLSFSDVDRMLKDSPGQVKKITVVNGSNVVIIEREGKDPQKVQVPDEGGKELLIKKATDANVAVDAKDEKKEASGLDIFLAILLQFGPILLFVFLIFWFMGRAAQNQQKQIQQQLSRTKESGDKSRIDKKTFADVAGCDEAIRKLQRIKRFMTGTATFSMFGARLPKGVLLYGPSGTGKTLLAKALAGETEGTFLSMSGSDFVEMFVGVGASRVRELFSQARAEYQRTKKPVILFIDEIDAVGGKRSSGYSGGGHQEREQTLNAILVEMDGMAKNSGIVVIAATNRIDILDPALLRPGRFDYHVQVDLPDMAGRERIFGVHVRGKKLHSDVDLKVLAARTYGFSGADIEAACNEAAIIAGERVEEEVAELRKAGKNEKEINDSIVRAITLKEFDEAADVVKLGEARTSRAKAMSADDKWNTTVHEVGHAWLSGYPVNKITIVPRERALGYTQAMPEGDLFSFTEKQARQRIRMALGGRVAQEVFTGTVDTGASNDFEQACNMARNMVTKWGMSKLGHISVGDPTEGPFGGVSQGAGSFGPELANEIDRAWRAIIAEEYAEATRIIRRDKGSIEEICKVLMAQETILAPQWKELLQKFPPRSDNPAAGESVEAPAAESAAQAAEPEPGTGA